MVSSRSVLSCRVPSWRPPSRRARSWRAHSWSVHSWSVPSWRVSVWRVPPCYYHLLHLLASLAPVARPCSSSPAGLAVSSGIDRRCAFGFALWRGLGGPENRLRKVKLESTDDTTCVQQALGAHARVKRELTYKLFLLDDSHVKS